MYIFWNYQSKAIRYRKLKLILVGCDDKYIYHNYLHIFLFFNSAATIFFLSPVSMNQNWKGKKD